jgi:hypothetical protein
LCLTYPLFNWFPRLMQLDMVIGDWRRYSYPVLMPSQRFKLN